MVNTFGGNSPNPDNSAATVYQNSEPQSAFNSTRVKFTSNNINNSLNGHNKNGINSLIKYSYLMRFSLGFYLIF